MKSRNSSTLSVWEWLNESWEKEQFNKMKLGFASILDSLIMNLDEKVPYKEKVAEKYNDYHLFLKDELKWFSSTNIEDENKIKNILSIDSMIINPNEDSTIILEAYHKYLDKLEAWESFDINKFNDKFWYYLKSWDFGLIKRYFLLLFHVKKSIWITEWDIVWEKLKVTLMLDNFIFKYAEYFNIDFFRYIFWSPRLSTDPWVDIYKFINIK